MSITLLVAAIVVWGIADVSANESTAHLQTWESLFFIVMINYVNE
jgi:hypothetical protein